MKTPRLSFLKPVLIFTQLLFVACQPKETIEEAINYHDLDRVDDPIDLYIREKLTKPYNCRVIYKYLDSHIPDAFNAVPPRRDVIVPVVDLIIKAWIEPFIYGADGDDTFIKRYFPPEIVLVGSPFYQDDGTIVLGTADSGVRVTLTRVNDLTQKNEKVFAKEVFKTLFHEFAHIVDQNFNFDAQQFYELTQEGYTSLGLWQNISFAEAVQRGNVSPYATSLPTEDFAEMVAHIVTLTDQEFSDLYFDNNKDCDFDSSYSDCLKTKEGQNIIQEKYNLVLEFFKSNVGVDLLKVRDAFLLSTKSS